MKKVALTRSELKKHSEKIYDLMSTKSLASIKGGRMQAEYENIAYSDTTYVRG